MSVLTGLRLQVNRDSFRITLSVWKALLLREALARLFAKRAAWFWLIAEPVIHMAYMGFLYSVIRHRHVGGMDVMIWLVVGLQGFFLFRRTGSQMMGAVEANKALFAYRQVMPIDTVLMRGFLEFLLMMAVMIIIFMGLALLGHDVLPSNMLMVMESLFGLWLLGLALGLIVSAATEIAGEIRRVITMAMMPLYLLSGVIVPISSIPPPYRDWLLLNPIAHGLEGAREGFSSYYQPFVGLSVGYLYEVALIGIFVGLLLHRRFAERMMTQ